MTSLHRLLHRCGTAAAIMNKRRREEIDIFSCEVIGFIMKSTCVKASFHFSHFIVIGSGEAAIFKATQRLRRLLKKASAKEGGEKSSQQHAGKDSPDTCRLEVGVLLMHQGNRREKPIGR